MRAYKTAYAVPLPVAGVNPYSLQFTAKIAGNVYGFLFQWVNNAWILSVTIADGSVRLASTVPGVTAWTAYPDYGLVLMSTLTTLGQNDLASVSMYWIVWA